MIAATGDDAVGVLAKSDGPARRLIADGWTDRDFRTAVARAADSDDIDSYKQLDRAVQEIDSLSTSARKPARELVKSDPGDGIKAISRFEQAEEVVDLEAFVRTIKRFDKSEKAEMARMVSKADDGAQLADELDYGQLKRIADQGAGRSAARLSNRDVAPSNIRRLVDDDNIDLTHVDDLMTSTYRSWSSKGTGFSGHHTKHADEWDPTLTKSEYRTKARELMNRNRDDIEVYYQKGNDNLAVYDRSTNELAVGGRPQGRIQTLFRPDQPLQYIDRRVGSELIEVK
ncbi:hypothetical protein [Halococcoides cellulosivorans]|uniref:Uncharacterized protein n=1 Tax=Halococcoides cellulosivorans TaxID=1679096 RepID=A0A2R4WXT4_9EURY|nr:hypothetical protein [Halococcoides cellulosivorans]AWB26348.1 hypothetical protein HARCEL1_00730 [Halococcoides cellulosivorans]